MKETLRVLPKGMAMVPVYEEHERVRRYHGWKHDPTLGELEDVYDWTKGQKTGQKRKSGGFVKLEASAYDQVLVLPCTTEYIRHLREGDLWPADEATAVYAGRAFDPTYGGEHALKDTIEFARTESGLPATETK